MHERLSRRRFLVISSVFAASSLAAACGQQTPPTPTTAPAAPTTAPAAQATTAPAPTTAAAPTAGATAAAAPTAAPKPTAAPTAAVAATPKPAQKVSLSFWGAHSGATELQAYKDMAAEYSKLNPNVTFSSVQGGAQGQASFNELLLSKIAAGNPPDVGLIFSTPVSLGVRGSLLSLDDLMMSSKYSAKENWPGPVLASCEWKGKTYGFPTHCAVYGMYFNQDMFAAAGLPTDQASFPKTWDELRAISPKFTKWNGNTLQVGGYIPFAASWDAELLPIWFGLNGGKTFDPDTPKYTIDLDANAATLDYALSWLDSEYKGDITKVQNSGSWGMYPGKQGQAPAWQNGRLAAIMDGSWEMNSMYDLTQASGKPVQLKWNYAPIPYGPGGTKSVSGFWPNWWVIPKGTKYREDAFNYVDWVNGDGIRIWFSQIADLPPNKKFPHDLLPSEALKHNDKSFVQGALSFFYGQFDASVPMWTSPVEDFSVDQLSRALERVSKKAAKAKDALAEAQKASQAELEKLLKSS